MGGRQLLEQRRAPWRRLELRPITVHGWTFHEGNHKLMGLWHPVGTWDWFATCWPKRPGRPWPTPSATGSQPARRCPTGK